MNRFELGAKACFLGWSERRWLVVFCAVAAARVFILCAAFPFFNNVDEQEHFDLVLRYSRGNVPRVISPLAPESTRYIALGGSPEYRLKPEQFPGGTIPSPLWRQPVEKIQPLLERRASVLASAPNHETQSPPLYYALAGMWMKLGRLCGMETVFLLYWIRFLNALVMVGVVWLTSVAARAVFPEVALVRFLAPALAAAFPQAAFYGIQNDVLSPLCWGVAFVCIAVWFRKRELSPRLALIAGAAIGAAYLTKLSNFPTIAAAFVIVAWGIWRQRIDGPRLSPAAAGSEQGERAELAGGLQVRGCCGWGQWRSNVLLPGLLLGCALLLVGAWFAWCKHAYGDLTGSKAKTVLLGWMPKPVGQWWAHPIFTPGGMWTFVSELIPSFWRGELVWHNERLSSPWIDMVYVISSILFCGAAIVSLARGSIFSRNRKGPLPSSPAEGEREKRRPVVEEADISPVKREVSEPMLWFCVLSIAASAMFLAWLSVVFDFGPCLYPSRTHPYLTSGRLMSGALIPFVLLYAYGLDRLLSRFSDVSRQRAGLGLVLLILVSGIALDIPAFASQYNWFHLWT
jgi:hypothetical protein